MKDLVKLPSHTIETRNSKNSVVIEHVKSNGKKSFFFNGSESWNKLKVSTRCIMSQFTFKKECKNHLLDQMDKEFQSEFLYY